MEKKESFNCVVAGYNSYYNSSVDSASRKYALKLVNRGIPLEYFAISFENNVFRVVTRKKTPAGIVYEEHPETVSPSSRVLPIDGIRDTRPQAGLLIPENINKPIVFAYTNHRELGEILAFFTKDLATGEKRIYASNALKLDNDKHTSTLEELVREVTPKFELRRYLDIYDTFVKNFKHYR